MGQLCFRILSDKMKLKKRKMKKVLFTLFVLLFVCGCTTQNNTDFVAAQEDEDAFVIALTDKLVEKGWGVSDISANTFGVTTPDDGVYLIEYAYESSEISRIMIYSIWLGVGTSNLESDVLSIVNQANDEQYLAKVSVDSDGDFWLETVLPFSSQLDVNFFCNYVEWFEESETILLLNYFSDYLQK